MNDCLRFYEYKISETKICVCMLYIVNKMDIKLG